MPDRTTRPRPGARPPAVGVGLGLAGLYLVAALGTMVLSDRPFRPLFDGLAPALPYRWVNPPREVARDNRQPTAASTEARLGPEGSTFLNVTPEDGQAIVFLEEKEVPPHPPDTAVTVTVTPFDALTLGPLPEDMSAQSNAYRVEVAYRPSGVTVSDLRVTTSSIALVGAGASDALLYSRDGRSWDQRPTTPLGSGHGLETTFAGAGYYVVTDIDDEPEDGGGTSPLVVGLVLVVPPLLVAGLVVRSRRATAAAAAAAAKAAANRRARPRPGGRKSKRRRR